MVINSSVLEASWSSDKSTVLPLERVRMLVEVAYERVCSSSVVELFKDERSTVVVLPPSVMVKMSVVVLKERLVINSSVVEAIATLVVETAVIRPSSSTLKVTSSVDEP